MSRASFFRNRNSTIHRSRTSIIDDSQLFPILDVRDISHLLQQCDFDVIEEQIIKPNGQFMISITERFLDDLTSTSIESLNEQILAVGKSDSNGSEQNGHENSEPATVGESPSDQDDTSKSLNLVVLARKAGEFYQTCGITDFSLMDMLRPEPARTRKILSAVVNYIRFREQRANELETYVAQASVKLEELRAAEDENIAISNQITDLKNQLETNVDTNGKSKPSLKELNIYNGKVENELRKLKKIQESLTNEHAQYKNEKHRLIQSLEDINYIMLNQGKQIELLKSYDQVDIENLNQVLQGLRSTFTESNEKLALLELQNRNISITVDSLQTVENELRNLSRILDEAMTDVEREEQVTDSLTRVQETLDQLKFESTDLDRQIQQTTRQLNAISEKTKKLREQSEEKSVKSQEAIDKLQIDYDEALKERNRRDEEVERIREQTSLIESQMRARRAELEQETTNSEMAVARLNSHIKLYLKEMNNKLNEN